MDKDFNQVADKRRDKFQTSFVLDAAYCPHFGKDRLG